jgi:hypothetical protein
LDLGEWPPLYDLSRHTVDDPVSTSKAVQPGKNEDAPEDPTSTPSELH